MSRPKANEMRCEPECRKYCTQWKHTPIRVEYVSKAHRRAKECTACGLPYPNNVRVLFAHSYATIALCPDCVTDMIRQLRRSPQPPERVT